MRPGFSVLFTSLVLPALSMRQLDDGLFQALKEDEASSPKEQTSGPKGGIPLPPLPMLNPAWVEKVKKEEEAKQEEIQMRETLHSQRLGMLSGSLEDRRGYSIFVNELLKTKFEMFVSEAGGVPREVQYAVVTCGSVGRLEMSPYSDIDYMVVVSDASDDVKAFFQEVARSVRCLFASTDRKCPDARPWQCGPKGYGIPMCEFMVPEVSPELLGTPDQLAALQLDEKVVAHIKNAMLDVRFVTGEKALFDAFLAKWFEVARGDETSDAPGPKLALEGLKDYPNLEWGKEVHAKNYMKAIELPVTYISVILQLRDQSLPAPVPVHVSDRLQWLAARGALPQEMADALYDAHEFFYALRVQIQNSRAFEKHQIEVETIEESAQEQIQPLVSFIDCFDGEAFAWRSSFGYGKFTGNCLVHLKDIKISRAPEIVDKRQTPLIKKYWAADRKTPVNHEVDYRK